MLTGILGGTAAFSVIGVFWERIKAFMMRCYSIFVVTVTVNDKAAYAMSMYLLSNFKRSRFCEVDIIGKNEYVRPQHRNQVVAFRQIPSNPTIYRQGWKWLTVQRVYDEQVKLRFLRGSFDPNALVLKAVDNFNSRETTDRDRSRFFVRRKQGSIGESDIKAYMRTKDGGKKPDGDAEAPVGQCNKPDRYTSEILGWDFNDIGQPQSINALSMLSLSADAQNACEQAARWRRNEDWFKERRIPWKYGMTFMGKPGTGKTVTARSIAEELNVPVFIFDLPTMSNQDFVEAWDEAKDWAPCMALFEDFDAVFHGRTNVTDTGMQTKLTFDCFLNILDGIENSEGMLVILTTNNLKDLDPALSGGGNGSRPGRINRVVNFGILDEAGKLKMASRIFAELPRPQWEDLLNHDQDFTGAQFQDACCQRALELWESKRPQDKGVRHETVLC